MTATAGRYTIMAINVLATLIIARLMKPEAYGVAILGGTILATAEAVRAIGGGAYIIQRPVLAPEDTRTAFTISVFVTLLLAAPLAMLSGQLARALSVPDLQDYLRVILWGFLAGPFTYLVGALLSRQMAFGIIAIISVSVAFINAVISVTLSLLGFGCMSFAWASTISAGSGLVISLIVWRDWTIFYPNLQQWRSVVSFGAFDSTTAILAQLGQSIPYFIFAKLLNAETVGLCQRTLLLCLVPERMILAGVGAIALPAFSRQAREGGNVKAAYLRATELLTAAHWPALILLICLADPIIRVLLGAQWQAVAPLTRVFAAALLFSFPLCLNYPLLVALGAIRYLPPIVALQIVVSLTVLFFAAARGLHAVALSTLLIIPFNSLLSLLLVRRLLALRWRELATATFKSAVVSVLCAVGPATTMVITLGRPDAPIRTILVAAIFCAAGWIGGLWVTRHPLLYELRRAAHAAGILALLQQIGTHGFQLASGHFRK